MKQLKTAILGLDDKGELLLEAAYQSGYFEIVAAADKDLALCEKASTKYNCAVFDDYRQLITQNQVDCLLTAAGTYSCGEYLRAAIKKKFNIFKLSPLARNFTEATEFVQLCESENVKLAVSNPYRFAESFSAMNSFIAGGGIEQIFLINAVCIFGQPYPIWQNDPKQSGGGVLIRNCYQIIDQILWNFGLPQQVYSLNSNNASDKQQRLSLTEDTATLTIKINETCFGNLTASRRPGMGPKQEFIDIYGKNKILRVSDMKFSVMEGSGLIKEEFDYKDSKHACMVKSLENFAQSISAPDKVKLFNSGHENLKNMAVVEAAYLSARTGMPEQPERILQMA